MTANEIRARYYTVRNKYQALTVQNVANDIAMLQAEMATECAAQLAEINQTVSRINIVNWEELSLRLNDYFRKNQD